MVPAFLCCLSPMLLVLGHPDHFQDFVARGGLRERWGWKDLVHEPARSDVDPDGCARPEKARRVHPVRQVLRVQDVVCTLDLGRPVLCRNEHRSLDRGSR